MDEKLYWVGFNLVRGIGAVRLAALCRHFGSASAAWVASAGDLRAAGLGAKLIAELVRVRAQVDLQQHWDRIQVQNITVITSADAGYPARLAHIEQPPPVLYLRGTWTAADDRSIAIVGTRQVTAYGRQIAEQVAGYLAGRGITVVSGLARGIDSLAHGAALMAGGRTAAVLGSGVDQIYPPENRQLAQKIINHGALISDYPPGSAPDGANFPARNRIISGLTRATVVVEAGEKSGALITARFAADQGRDVYAVPGNVLSPQSKGTNALIQRGAVPLLNPDDLIEALEREVGIEQPIRAAAVPDDAFERTLYVALSQEPLHVDELVNLVDAPIERVSAALVMMELKGAVRRVGGMQYSAVREVQSGYFA